MPALSTEAILGLFAAAAIVVFFSGIRMTAPADRIADRTGLEALIGGVLLGPATSLLGTVV